MSDDPSHQPAHRAAPAVPRPDQAANDADPDSVLQSQTSIDVAQAEERVQAALAASSRTGASLSALHRAIEQVTSGLSDARDANTQLADELSRVRLLLETRTQQKTDLEQRISQLEALVGETKKQAEREKNYLMEEQDRFLAALLDDQEQALALAVRERDEARAELSRASSPPANKPTNPAIPAVHAAPADEELRNKLRDAARTIDKLTRERERSRDVLRRLQAQRDEAQRVVEQLVRDLEQARAQSGKPPAAVMPAAERPTDPERPAAHDPAPSPGAIKIRSSLAEALAATHPGGASAPPEDQRPTPPPEELRAAVTGVRPLPPLPRKPDPTTRPIGSYALSGDSVDTPLERVSTRPPRR